MKDLTGLLDDRSILDLAEQGMIEPYVEELEREGVISYGPSSYGYDVRLGNVFKIASPFQLANSNIIDPKKVDDDHFTTVDMTDYDGPIVIPAHGFILGHTIEVFDIPSDVFVLAVGKSTYARAGISINVTPIEPGFRGQVVLEISNHTPKPVFLYPGEGISQFVFIRGARPCETDYEIRRGKYQDQRGVTHGKV